MNENPAITETEQSADQQDAFLEGWGEPETAEDADQQTDTAGGTAEPETSGAAEGESAAEDEAAEPETNGEQAAAAEAKPANDTAWSVKVLGQQRTVRAEEITPELLQKGFDYDRIRGKYDEAKPVIELMTASAKQAGMELPAYIAKIRQETKRAGGMSEEEAKRAVELEDREAAVAALEEQKREGQLQEQAAKERMKRDLSDFEAAFPDAYKQAKSDPDSIPQSVWDAVNAGKSLTAAWAEYAVQQANKRADTTALNGQNAARSTGSMKSAGSDKKTTDAFLVGWGS